MWLIRSSLVLKRTAWNYDAVSLAERTNLYQLSVSQSHQCARSQDKLVYIETWFGLCPLSDPLAFVVFSPLICCSFISLTFFDSLFSVYYSHKTVFSIHSWIVLSLSLCLQVMPSRPLGMGQMWECGSRCPLSKPPRPSPHHTRGTASATPTPSTTTSTQTLAFITSVAAYR